MHTDDKSAQIKGQSDLGVAHEHDEEQANPKLHHSDSSFFWRKDRADLRGNTCELSLWLILLEPAGLRIACASYAARVIPLTVEQWFAGSTNILESQGAAWLPRIGPGRVAGRYL